MNESLKTLISEMSPDALMEIIDIIRARNDIASVIVTTQKEVDEMDAYYKKHYEKIVGVCQGSVNESA